MSQPAIFPYISGLDKYHGLTGDEAISLYLENNTDAIAYKNVKELWAEDDKNYAWKNKHREFTLEFAQVSLYEQEVDILAYLNKYSADKSKPDDMRLSAESLFVEIVLQVRKLRGYQE